MKAYMGEGEDLAWVPLILLFIRALNMLIFNTLQLNYIQV
jgi:hypothetical protein